MEHSTSPFSLSRLLGKKKLISFLLCVFLASIIWVVNALNKTQHYTLEIKLNYDEAWLKTWTAGDQPNKIKLEISGKGFDIVNFLYENNSTTININEAILFNNKKELSSLELVQPLFTKYEKQITFERIIPKTISLPARKLYFKKVAIKPNYDIGLKSTFMISGPSVCVPDSVMLSSKNPFPDTLNSIYTIQYKIGNVSSTVFGNVELMLPEQLNLVPEKKTVWIYIPIEESTEKIIDISVTPILSSGRGIELIPNIIKLTCRVPISRYDQTIAARFNIIATVNSNLQKKAIVSVKNAPFWADHISTKPATLDYFYHNP